MNLQRPTQRLDRDRLLTVVGLTVTAGYALLGVVNLVAQIAGGL